MEFKLTFNMDNAAFSGDYGQVSEIIHILDKVKKQIDFTDGSAIMDSNGNKVGEWGITD
jgi:hypothetical protein